MTIDPWILTFSALTVIATIWMGFWSARKSKTASDFFVAGRSVSVGWNASAISGEYLSAASFMGVAGMVMSSGYDALWYPVCYACGYLFLLLFIAGPLRRFGAYTIPDFAEGRFDSPVFRKIAVVFVLFIGFFYTMPQMKGAGTTLAYIFPGLPYWAGVVLVGAVITLNVALGGMKGITLVQAFQYWAKMFAISVPIFVLMAVYGHYGKQVECNHSDIPTLPFKTASELGNALSNSPLSPRLLFVRAENALTVDDALKSAGAAKNYARKILRTDQYHFSTNRPTLVELREAYAYLIRKTVFYYRDARDGERVPFDSSRYLTAAATASAIEDIFRTNGSAVLHLNSTQAVFLNGKLLRRLTNGLAATQKPLPDNAPTESTSVRRIPDAAELPWFTNTIQAPPMSLTPAPSSRRSSGTALIMTPKGTAELVLNPDLIPTSNLQVIAESKSRSLFVKLGGKNMKVPDAAAKLVFDRQLSRLDNAGAKPNIQRQPLPDKAPRDETWLNPFGPLTTKAAKAAKPTLTHPGPWQTGSVIVADAGTGNKLPKRAANYVDAKLQDNTQVGQTGQVSATSLFYNYGYYLGRSEKLNPDGYMQCLTTKGIDQITIDWPGFPLKPNREVAAGILRALTTNGVTVIRESRSVFKAFPTRDATVVPVNTKPYSLLYTYSLIIALVCGTAGLPHILVRFYTNPDGVAAKRTTMWVMILIGVFYLFPPVFGVFGRNLLPELYAGVGAKGTDKIVLELPRILNERFGALGSILSGITCAGAFAAFMSTFSGLLVSMTGALAHDVYGRMLRPQSTPRQRMRAFRIAAVIVGAVAILLGMQVEPFQINFMVGQAFAIAAASYFPLLFMSAWWRGMTMRGAATGMLTGGLLALGGITLTSFSDLKWIPLDEFWASHPLLRNICEQPAIWAVPLAITLMVVVSKLTSREIPSDIRMKMLVLHAPEKLGLKQEYIQEHQHGH